MAVLVLVCLVVVTTLGSLVQTSNRPTGWVPPPPGPRETPLAEDSELRASRLAELEQAGRQLVQADALLDQAYKALPPGPQPAELEAQVAKFRLKFSRDADDLGALRGDYLQMRPVWYGLVQEFRVWFRAGAPRLPAPPPFRSELYYSLLPDPQAQAYRQQYAALAMKYARLQLEVSTHWREQFARLGEAANDLGTLRRSLLRRLGQLGYLPILDPEAQWFSDVGLELSIIPERYRVLISLTGAHYEDMLDDGYPGYLRALQNLCWLLLVPILPLGLYQIQSRLRSLGRPIPEGGRGLGWRLGPWLVQLAVLQVEVVLLRDTALDLITPLVDMAQAYVLYRMFLEVSELVTRHLAPEYAVLDPVETASRSERTARGFGRLLLTGAIVQDIIHSATGPNLIYIMAGRLISFFAIVYYWVEAYSWRPEVAALLQRLLGMRTAGRLAHLVESRAGVVLAPLLAPLALLLLIVRSILSWMLSFPWARGASAGLLRRWVESTRTDPEVELLPVTAEYRANFLNSQFDNQMIWAGQGELLTSLRQGIETMLAGQASFGSILLVGPRGSGRTLLVEWLAQEFAQRATVLQIEIPPRTVSAEVVRNLWAPTLALTPPALVIMNKAHNLFLGRVGGFEAHQQARHLLSEVPPGVAVCASINDESWLYLRRVFPQQSEQNLVVHVPRWSEAQLRTMILERHRQVGGTLRYAAGLLRAVDDPAAVAAAEEVYFRLLAQQSVGNPTVAIEYWLGSLRHNPQEPDTWLVDLPPRPNPAALLDINPEMLFVYAALVRHQNLSAEEATEVTGLAYPDVWHTLVQGLRHGLLVEQSPGRYQVATAWSVELGNHLRRKNLLYGE